MTSGGIMETKKIGDYAQEHGVAMAMHMAGTPIAALASVHCAAATENFLALGKSLGGHPPLERSGRSGCPSRSCRTATSPCRRRPVLGFTDLNLEACREFLHPDDPGIFEATDQWTRDYAHDRLWS